MVRVLIVDDDPATVSFMQLAFEAAGDEVATATSVDGALAQVATRPPDVILSDLTLASDGDASDGFALLQMLREQASTSHVGVIAVSGDDHPEVLRAAEDRGFDGFVAKPVDVPSLVERVRRLGATVRARRAEGHVDRTDQLGDVERLGE